MLVGLDTYRKAIDTFIMPSIKKIFEDHAQVVTGYGINACENSGEVTLCIAYVPTSMTDYYFTYSIGEWERTFLLMTVIDMLTNMGFNRDNLSFGYDTISFKNFEFHKKVLGDEYIEN